jgi:hypothetical protein
MMGVQRIGDALTVGINGSLKKWYVRNVVLLFTESTFWALITMSYALYAIRSKQVTVLQMTLIHRSFATIAINSFKGGSFYSRAEMPYVTTVSLVKTIPNPNNRRIYKNGH